MKINPQQLSVQLDNKLSNVYLVFGAEILLIEQSITQIITAAKQADFNEKCCFEIDGNFDWDELHSNIAARSLFSLKRIVECRLQTGKLGIHGSKELTQIITTLPKDIILIVCAGKLGTLQQKSKWFQTLDKCGEVVQHWEVKNEQLPNWIANQMKNIGLQSNQEIAQSIAFYTQGNLLATMQEIQKLSMAYPDGKINTLKYLEQISQQSQYTIYGLIDAALLGDANQMSKIYQVLMHDNAMPVRLSYALHKEIKSIIIMLIELKKTNNIASVLENHRVWKSRIPLVMSTLKRHSYQNLQKILLLLGRIDRSIKGMDNLNFIEELHVLLFALTGKKRWT